MVSVLTRIARIMGKTVFLIFLTVLSLYFFISYIIIPVGVPITAKTLGTKVLAHPVSLKAAWFNPFTLHLSLHELQVSDPDKQLIAGFKKFWVNVSFVSLLKKQVRVESLGLDGLAVNIVLLPDNQINLLSLVPAQPGQKPAQPVTAPEQPAPGAPSGPLPDVAVDKITLTNGTITFTDQAIAPGFTTRLGGMDLLITGISTKPDSRIKLAFTSGIDDKGRIEIQGQLKPFVQPLQMETVFSLNDYAMRALTPYVGKYTGRAVKEGGTLNIKVDYRIAENKLVAAHRLFIQKFDFGEKVESKDALPLPFGLALALLEDPQNRITISLPVHGDISDPKFEYFHLVIQVARNFFMKLVTAPFKMLLAVVPTSGAETSEETSTISFAPGSAILTDENKEKVDLLVKAMADRPKISLEINGSYDTGVDWKELKTHAFEDNLKARLAESSFNELRVFEDMYKAAFGYRGYWGLAREFTKDKKLDEEALKIEARRRIIEKGSPDKAALEALAQARAQVVYDAILAAGLDPARLTLGLTRTTQAGMDQVPLEFTLKIVGDASN